MQVKPWMKYTGIGVVGLLVGVGIGAGGGGESNTTTVSKTSPPTTTTVVSTQTVSPKADKLAELRAKVQDARSRYVELRGRARDEKAKLDELTGAVASAKENTIPGTGTFVVGEDIQPGVYRAAAHPGCYWARLNSLDTSDIADNDNADGPVAVEILSTDKAFLTNGCADFHKSG